jgi:uncharacterized membrane protein YhaH (DUF805 family)
MKEGTTSIRPGRSPSSNFWMLFLYAMIFAVTVVSGVMYVLQESYFSASCLLTVATFTLMLGIYSVTRMAIADERASDSSRLPFNPWLGLTKRQALKTLLDDPSEADGRKLH